MDENTEQLKRDTLALIARTNMEVSEAKNRLFAIQGSEAEYVREREARALDAVAKVLEDSRGVVAEAQANHQGVKDTCREVSELCGFLSEASAKFSAMLADFEARADKWDADVGAAREELAGVQLRQQLLATAQDNERKNIARDRAKILSDLRVIDSRQQQIRVALEVMRKKEKNNG